MNCVVAVLYSNFGDLNYVDSVIPVMTKFLTKSVISTVPNVSSMVIVVIEWRRY